jgi:hypothetical protein
VVCAIVQCVCRVCAYEFIFGDLHDGSGDGGSQWSLGWPTRRGRTGGVSGATRSDWGARNECTCTRLSEPAAAAAAPVSRFLFFLARRWLTESRRAHGGIRARHGKHRRMRFKQ